jgi:hypothetical protein
MRGVQRAVANTLLIWPEQAVLLRDTLRHSSPAASAITARAASVGPVTATAEKRCIDTRWEHA